MPVKPDELDPSRGFRARNTNGMADAERMKSNQVLDAVSHDKPTLRCADGTYKTSKAGFCRGT